MFVQKGRSMLFYTCNIVYRIVNVVHIIVENQRVLKWFYIRQVKVNLSSPK